MVRVHIEFPCGMLINYVSGFFDFHVIKLDNLECPLHGKKCKKENRR